MYGYIYETTNLINGKKYIGQRKAGRTALYLGSGVALKRAIKKYGKENFVKRIICECGSKEELDLMEIHYITEANAVESDQYYNLVDGGSVLCGEKNPRFGKKHTEETKQKMSVASKGKTKSVEHRRNLSAAIRGVKRRPLSNTTKTKISGANKGKVRTEEVRRTQSKRLKGIIGRTHTTETKEKLQELAKTQTRKGGIALSILYKDKIYKSIREAQRITGDSRFLVRKHAMIVEEYNYQNRKYGKN